MVSTNAFTTKMLNDDSAGGVMGHIVILYGTNYPVIVLSVGLQTD